MLNSVETALADLEGRFDRLERQRKRLARTVMALSVVVLVLIVIAGMYFGQRADARNYYNTQLRNLACLAVKRAPATVSPTIRDLREHYDCPPYQAPTTKPNGRPIKPVPRGARGVPTAAASSTAAQPSARAGPGRARVRTVTRTPAASTAPSPIPASATPSRTPSPSPSPTPTRTGLLDPVCGLVHLPILCRTEHP